MAFLEKNYRNPSHHRIEEDDMFNWVRANKKLRNTSKLKEEKLEKFNKLLILAEEHENKTNTNDRVSGS